MGTTQAGLQAVLLYLAQAVGQGAGGAEASLVLGLLTHNYDL
jgi:hypothetical protein